MSCFVSAEEGHCLFQPLSEASLNKSVYEKELMALVLANPALAALPGGKKISGVY